ncbi:MAG: AsmA-like C-terminal region-containing protein, partial [Pseudomonadota bacterium]
ALPNMASTFEMDGTMVLDGEPVEINLELDSPRAFLDGQETQFDGRLSLTGLSGSAQGMIPAGTGLGFSGAVSADVSDFDLIKSLLPEPIPALDLMDQVSLSANLSQPSADQVMTLSDVKVSVSGDSLQTAFEGAGNYAPQNGTVSGSGTFDAVLADAGPTIRSILPDLPAEADLAGRVSTEGAIMLQDNNITIQNLIAQTQSDAVDSRYEGDLSVQGENISLNGALTASIASLNQINEQRTEAIPYASLIESVSLTTNLTGSLDDLTLSDLDLTLADGDLNGQFTGTATVSEVVSLNGSLDVNSPSARRIASESGTDLPTAKGDATIFEAFALSGTVTGSTDAMTLSGATLSLDDITATGEFGISLNGVRPKVTGQLKTDSLDLRPYMDAYTTERPSGQVEPWSEDTIPVEGLSAINTDFDLTANAIQLSQMSLGATEANVDLTNGRLTITVPNMTLYGGQGDGTFILDGSTPTPTVSITAGLNRLQSDSFLNAVAGFTQASGTGRTRVTLSGSGISQAAIMQSMNGDGTFGISDGAISGIDAAEFLTGLQNALTTRSLPSGLGPLEKTQFKDLVGGFSLQNGVAEIQSFSITGASAQLDGSGRIDMGNQTVDIRLQPKAVGAQAKGITAFGIPLRIKGPFGASLVTLDTEGLTQILQARAAEEARNAISDRVGGPAGSILGSILGGTPTETTPQPAEEDNAAEHAEAEEEAEPEKPEDLIEDGLRQLFGVKRPD